MWTAWVILANDISLPFVNETRNETEQFFENYYKKPKTLNSQNQVFHKFTRVSSNNPININQIKISLTRTDYFSSKLSKVIHFEETQSLIF